MSVPVRFPFRPPPESSHCYALPAHLPPTKEVHMETNAWAEAMAPVIILWSLLGGIVTYVFYGFALTGIFRKAGLKTWPAWVPFFNTWRVLQLGGQKGWWLLVGLIPVIGPILYLVYLIIAGVKIQSAFGKPGVFYILAILVTPVWYGILAWDSSTWQPRHTPLVPADGYETTGGARA